MVKKNTRALVCTIGDEILIGQILDTNAQWLCSQLDGLGIEVGRKMTISDREEEILWMLELGFRDFDLIVSTGGLGPTKDDITKATIAKFFKAPLIEDKDILRTVTGFFERRGRPMLEVNKQQAWVPKGCRPMNNRWGTAPGMWMEKNGKVLICLPGVPHEMKNLMISQGLDWIRLHFHTPFIFHKTIKTAGIGESFLMEKIKDWEESLPQHIKLAYLPSLGEVKLRLSAIGEEAEKLKVEVRTYTDRLRNLAGKFIYGEDEESLSSAVGSLLKARKLTLATAESCTGGHLAHQITSIPGSSQYFLGSIIAYDNAIKERNLMVRKEDLEKYGAVSRPVVEQMAVGVRKQLSAAIGVATSGVAGPDGGTQEKPVGTVWIAYADADRIWSKKLSLTQDRLINIGLTSTTLLNAIRLILTGQLDKE